MPYIKQADRKPFDPLIEQLARLIPEKDFAGSLNYVVSRICGELLRREKNYARINEIMGALECAKLEFYRRMAAPYEDKKIAENGDAYGI